MENDEKTVHLVHTPEGVIFQVPVGQNLFCMIPLADRDLEALYQERKRRKQEQIIIAKRID